MDKDSIIKWLFGDGVGISSKTIASALLGVEYKDNDKPYDVSDFGRCVRLAEEAKLTESDLNKVAEVYPYWKPIIERWDYLSDAYISENYSIINNFLRTVTK